MRQMKIVEREGEGGRWKGWDDEDESSNMRLKISSEATAEEVEGDQTQWAILVAGSSGYENYRHQVSN
ncbi:hypothetical protein K1719_018965 [Acacia pycnantha]|nr:hypothetical protein K1719_018965 [Acacia pycnantha]